MRPISRRDRVVTFHQVITAENSMGEPVNDGSQPELCRERAQVIYGRGSERRAAAIEGVDQPATFIVLSNSGTREISVGNIIRFDGADWDIQNKAPLENREIEFTAIRRAR